MPEYSSTASHTAAAGRHGLYQLSKFPEVLQTVLTPEVQRLGFN